mmetsp:Transcript_53500/g.106510  ORF Transcript_53500/g.106510 Transcript_53500/m.106510 type:complete len:180 (-) Transcript_53500:85-624(-)|eukprot:CAMPEP_0172866136 /NCGR_PEP_ID=MMETSP1075-20121228/81815_1 /TAXON_ID=2916 /ORGANISM="Ceratium fusus, Strain PA161109" /LENGTH=179 /DNA_ID=CAMNT_0013715269 /DNA_START=45 /DNA_END=584 /DNA_ORIENTATION=+
MGACGAKLFAKPEELRILMVGLDAAGKTTILYKWSLGTVVSTIPTIGFNVEQVKYKKFQFTVWDVGGNSKIRPLWKEYFQGAHGLIYVVDSNDRDRINEAKAELGRMMNDEDMRDTAVLVFANKQDLPNAMSAADISDILGLDDLEGRRWFIQPSCATTGVGLTEGIDWISEAVATRKK